MQLNDFKPEDLGILLAADQMDVENASVDENGAKIPPNTQHRTILIGLGGTGIKTIDHVKREIAARLQPSWEQYIAFLGVDSDSSEIDRATSLKRNETVITTRAGAATRALHVNDVLTWNVFAEQEKVNTMLTSIAGNGASRTRLMGKMKVHDKEPGNIGVDEEIVEKLGALKGNVLVPPTGNGHYEVYVIGSVSGGTCSGSFLEMPALVRQALNTDNVHVYAMLYLPDTLANLDPINKAELEANGYASLKELNYYEGLNMRPGYPEAFAYNNQANPVLTVKPENDYFSLPYLVGTVSGPSANASQIARETIADFFISILGKTTTAQGAFLTDQFLNNCLMRAPAREKSPTNTELEQGADPHEFPKRFGAIGFAKAAAPTKIIKAYTISAACGKAGVKPVETTTRATMVANGVELLPFLGEQDFYAQDVGTRRATELLQPLQMLLDTFTTNEYKIAAAAGCPITWEDINAGRYDSAMFAKSVESYIGGKTDSDGLKVLETAVRKAFEAFKAKVKDFVAQEGPYAFANVFNGSFISQNDVAGTGIRKQLEWLRDGKDAAGKTRNLGLTSDQAHLDLDAKKQVVVRYAGIEGLIPGRRANAASSWETAFNTLVNTCVNEKRREAMFGAHGFIAKYFLEPSIVLCDQLRWFARILESMCRAYDEHGSKLGDYSSFRNVSQSTTEVNIAAVNMEAHDLLREQADRAAAQVNGRRVRDDLVASFFEDPTAWMEVPKELINTTTNGVTLANPSMAVPARAMFDTCMNGAINLNIDVSIQTMFQEVNGKHVSYDTYAQQIVDQLTLRSKVLFNGTLDERDFNRYIMYPASLKITDPEIARAIENAAGPGVGVFGSDYADSIMMYQLVGPFMVSRLRDLEQWERQYEEKIKRPNGLHGRSPDLVTTLDSNGTMCYSDVMKWYDYPAIVARTDPKKRAANGVLSHEGEVRTAIDKRIEDYKELGILYSEQDRDGKWSIYRVCCDKSITWEFDTDNLLIDRETGLYPAGKALASAVANQNGKRLGDIVRKVELQGAGLMSEPHKDEKWAWEYAARVLYAHRPMLAELRETAVLYRPWAEEVNAMNTQLLRAMNPAKMVRIMQGHILYKDENEQWILEGEDGDHIGIANLSPAKLTRLGIAEPANAALIENGMSMFYVFTKLMRNGEMAGDGLDRAVSRAKAVFADETIEDIIDESMKWAEETLRAEVKAVEALGGNLNTPARQTPKFYKAMEDLGLNRDAVTEICEFYAKAQLWRRV